MNAMQQALRQWVGAQVLTSPGARKVLGGILFVGATALAAQVAIPIRAITPVPISLQPLFVILAGAMLGPRAGALAMAAYVALGAAGAPVYAMGRAGFVWLMGPTGGYLLSYPAAAFVAGLLAGRSAGALRLLGALAAGMAMIYLGGLSQLWILTRQDLGVVFFQSVVPFLPGDLFKVLVAWMTVRSWRSTRFAQES